MVLSVSHVTAQRLNSRDNDNVSFMAVLWQIIYHVCEIIYHTHAISLYFHAVF